MGLKSFLFCQLKDLLIVFLFYFTFLTISIMLFLTTLLLNNLLIQKEKQVYIFLNQIIIFLQGKKRFEMPAAASTFFLFQFLARHCIIYYPQCYFSQENPKHLCSTFT